MKSPIDEFFKNFFGFLPNKPGQAYEILTAAALSIVNQRAVGVDERQKGQYSSTTYQIDSIIYDELGNSMVEAKDYTIRDVKVGRGDLQKLQGALTDLNFKDGIYVSATDFTSPAKKYSESTEKNPQQKSINLYHVRPSTKLDEKGRVKTISVELIAYIARYEQGIYRVEWEKDAISTLIKLGLNNSTVKYTLDKFYNIDGTTCETMEEFTRSNQPALVNFADEANGCWVLRNKFIKYEDKLLPIKGIEYKIPYSKAIKTFTIEAEGEPTVFIRSENGSVDTLINDVDLKATVNEIVKRI